MTSEKKWILKSLLPVLCYDRVIIWYILSHDLKYSCKYNFHTKMILMAFLTSKEVVFNCNNISVDESKPWFYCPLIKHLPIHVFLTFHNPKVCLLQCSCLLGIKLSGFMHQKQCLWITGPDLKLLAKKLDMDIVMSQSSLLRRQLLL